MYMQSLKIALVGHKIALTHATFWRLTYNTPSVVFKGSGIIQVFEFKEMKKNIYIEYNPRVCNKTWTLHFMYLNSQQMSRDFTTEFGNFIPS